MILALDIATVTGWALLKNSRKIKSGILNLKISSSRPHGHMLQNLTRELHGFHEISPLKYIAYEDVNFHASGKSAKRYYSLLAMVELWSIGGGRRVDLVPFSVAAIKKHATGKGNASKGDMIHAARRRGWTPCDHNEADALWILDLAIKTFRKEKENAFR